jgi:hypothetical protein
LESGLAAGWRAPPGTHARASGSLTGALGSPHARGRSQSRLCAASSLARRPLLRLAAWPPHLPVTLKWPAPISVLSSRMLSSVLAARSLATHLAGSQYPTRGSCRPAVTRMLGYLVQGLRGNH